MAVALAVDHCDTATAAQTLRRGLHLRRLQGCRPAEALAAAVQAALALPLEQLHAHVEPYGLFQPGADNSTETHPRLYAQHAQQHRLYAELCRRVIGLIGERHHLELLVLQSQGPTGRCSSGRGGRDARYHPNGQLRSLSLSLFIRAFVCLFVRFVRPFENKSKSYKALLIVLPQATEMA